MRINAKTLAALDETNAKFGSIIITSVSLCLKYEKRNEHYGYYMLVAALVCLGLSGLLSFLYMCCSLKIFKKGSLSFACLGYFFNVWGYSRFQGATDEYATIGYNLFGFFAWVLDLIMFYEVKLRTQEDYENEIKEIARGYRKFRQKKYKSEERTDEELIAELAGLPQQKKSGTKVSIA
eukprot:m.208147 g.208147  ORF g.208147 m.208147 type:complete len:179 (-) comp15807_c2_seq1:65-601(-)